MFHLILTIVCAMLVVALALATIWHGGAAFPATGGKFTALTDRKGPPPKGKKFWYLQ